jgi:hypothetical protein
MKAFSAAEIIHMWEHGAAIAPVALALSLLENAGMSRSGENLPALSIGERNGRLLALRESIFGRTLESVTECPYCETGIEFALDTKQLQQPERQEEVLPSCFSIGDISLQFRPINSTDLAVAAESVDGQDARRKLAERYVTEATQGGNWMDVVDLPEDVVQALSMQLAQIDSQADIALDLCCPECGGSWSAVFDIAAFLWTEINIRAKQLLGEVHTLAWAYGWSEADILAMSEARRQFYLDMVK